jgi:hypothetical protein
MNMETITDYLVSIRKDAAFISPGVLEAIPYQTKTKTPG